MTATVFHGAERKKKTRRSRRPQTRLTPYLFLAPGFLLFAACILYPMFSAARMSLYEWNIVNAAASRFIGLDNYIRAFSDENFWLALSNSGFYMVATVPPQIILGLAVALALRSAGFGTAKSVCIAAASGLLEPLGSLLGVGLSSGLAFAYPAGLGLAAGAMLFVVSHEVIPETHRNGHQTPATLGLMLGFALMMVLDTTLG